MLRRVRVLQQLARAVTLEHVEHGRLAVRVSLREEVTAEGERADPLHRRLADDLPVVVDVVTDQVFHAGGQLKVGRRRAVDQFRVEDVVGGQRAQLNRLARVVPLLEFLGGGQGERIAQTQPCGLNHDGLVDAGGFGVEDDGVHAKCFP
ncbi:hypothetical protein D3C81_1676150 [compost metagenome]